MEENCKYGSKFMPLEEMKIEGRIEYRKTTYVGDNSVEEVFEGFVDDIVRLLKAIDEIGRADS